MTRKMSGDRFPLQTNPLNFDSEVIWIHKWPSPVMDFSGAENAILLPAKSSDKLMQVINTHNFKSSIRCALKIYQLRHSCDSQLCISLRRARNWITLDASESRTWYVIDRERITWYACTAKTGHWMYGIFEDEMKNIVMFGLVLHSFQHKVSACIRNSPAATWDHTLHFPKAKTGWR